jgi:hypothetical protein
MAQYTYSYSYTGPKIWSPNDPILADQVNNMEAGIVEALN